MPASPMLRRQSGRRLRSRVQLAGQQEEEEEWCPAATFAFPESPPLLQPTRSEKMVATTERKLRRQTVMPRQTATTVASPTLSQRRTRRQSMMPVKLPSSPKHAPPKSRVTKDKPVALPPAENTTKAKTKRKLAEEIVTLEASPATKRRRLVPTSKSSTQVKTPASPPTSKKHKSLSALPVSRSTRKAQQSNKTASPQVQKAPAPSVESSRRKTPARKRALSPAQPSPGKATPSPPKRRAATRSKSESRLVRGKSHTRSQKKSSASQKSKSSVHIKSPASPVAKKLATSPREKPSKKTSSASLKASGSPATKPSPKKPISLTKKKAASETTPKKTGKAASKKTASSPAKTSPPQSTKKSQKKNLKTASKKTLPTPSKTPPANNKKTPTVKTPPSNKKKTPTTMKTPSSTKKTPATKTPPTNKKTPKKTPTMKTPPSQRKTQKKTPTVVSKKAKSPPTKTPKTPSSRKKKSASSVKVVSPKSPSPQKRRLMRSTAKSHMTSTSSSIKMKSLRVVLNGKSPPSSLASFRKTPSSKRVATASSPNDLGASPELPSAHKQLERIRNNIALARERRRSASATPRKSLPRTTTRAAKPNLDKVVTQADIHATASDKSDSEAALANHCDSSLQVSTPSARPPLPATPKSSRSSSVRVCHFSSRVASSSTSVQCFTRGAAPHSSTPIKGSHTLQDIDGKDTENSTTMSESMDDSLDSRRADTTMEESMNGVGEDTSMDESVEEPEEAEPTTQSRRSYCSLM